MAHGSRHHRRPPHVDLLRLTVSFQKQTLAGRMVATVTIQNLEVVQAIPEKTLSLSR